MIKLEADFMKKMQMDDDSQILGQSMSQPPQMQEETKEPSHHEPSHHEPSHHEPSQHEPS